MQLLHLIPLSMVRKGADQLRVLDDEVQGQTITAKLAGGNGLGMTRGSAPTTHQRPAGTIDFASSPPFAAVSVKCPLVPSLI